MRSGSRWAICACRISEWLALPSVALLEARWVARLAVPLLSARASPQEPSRTLPAILATRDLSIA